MDILKEKKVKARKSHRCDYCNGEISNRQIYKSTSIANDGTVYTWKSHTRCDKIVEVLGMFDEVYVDEGLTEADFCEFITESYRGLIGGLVTAEIGENIIRYREKKLPKFQVRLDYVCEHFLSDWSEET